MTQEDHRTERPEVWENAAAWFVRLRADDAGPGEAQAFEAWRRLDPVHTEAYRAVETAWQSPLLHRALERVDEGVRGAAPVPSQRTARRRRAGRDVWRSLAAAAAVVLLVLGGTWHDEIAVRLQADHQAPDSAQRRVVLADGSNVLLDAGAAIVTALDAERRTVRLLQGQAYFEVAADRGRPFVVAAGTAKVEVTGTAFAVGLGDDGTAVAVRHGSVAVANTAASTAAAPLGPGETARVTDDGIARGHAAGTAAAFAWTEGRLTFANRRLRDVVAELQRYHAGLIVVAGAELGEVRLTGSYRLDDPIHTAGLLADLASATLTRVSDHLLILH